MKHQHAFIAGGKYCLTTRHTIYLVGHTPTLIVLEDHAPVHICECGKHAQGGQCFTHLSPIHNATA